MSGLTEERAGMPHFVADYDALAGVVHDLRGRLGVLEERVRRLETGPPKPTWGKRCNLKPVPTKINDALLEAFREPESPKKKPGDDHYFRKAAQRTIDRIHGAAITVYQQGREHGRAQAQEELDECKHARELAESELAGERQECDKLRERAEKAEAINAALQAAERQGE